MNQDVVGYVVIGRNEGERLKKCFESLPKSAEYVVYVDSGSTDNSLQIAKSIGVQIVQLDMRVPFSAGRARNEGFAALINHHTDIEYAQFIDGDCELCAGWIDYAKKKLELNPQWAAVSGILKEKYPESSIYNQLCDIEWQTPIGEINSCGGIFMIRKNAFQEVNGFNPSVIAGEEPELCYRIRQVGWLIHGLDHLMAFHDASIYKFSQWWKRSMRSGYAYAQGVLMHGLGKEKYCIKDSLRIWFWAFIIPILILSFSCFVHYLYFLFFIIYIVNIFRIALRINDQLANWEKSFYYAFFNVLGKWAQFYGQLFFLITKIQKKTPLIIEYQ